MRRFFPRWREVLAVFGKERCDALRDRRTMLTVLIVSLVVGPLTLFLMTEYLGSLVKESREKVVRVDGIARAPELANFMRRNGVRIEGAPAGYQEAIRHGRLSVAVMRVPADFADRFARGQTASIEILHDSTNQRADPSWRIARQVLDAFNREQGDARLIVQGVSPSLQKVVATEEVDVASASARGSQILFIVPMLTLMLSAYGCLANAIDVTAGERERGSLEPLLGAPVARESVVVGKWLLVSAVGMAMIALMIAGYWGAARAIRNEELSAMMQFGWREVGIFATMLLPFVAMIAAAQMLLATFGRNFKEAQTYAQYLALLINFAPMVGLFLPDKTLPALRFIPALGQQLVMERALRGEALRAIDLLAPTGVAIVLTLAALTAIAALLRREDIIFGRA